jgi:hypothetical protein
MISSIYVSNGSVRAPWVNTASASLQSSIRVAGNAVFRDMGKLVYLPSPDAGTGAVSKALVLDSAEPNVPLKAYAYNELRFSMLVHQNPEEAERLLKLAADATMERTRPLPLARVLAVGSAMH